MAQARLCPACRNTRLSRYNPDPLCGPCTRAARTTPALAERGAPTWLWDSPPMRDALARVDLAAAVAVFRAAAGLSQHELADITGWSQSSLSLFESGHRDTLYDVRALLRFADAVDMPREALLPLVLGTASAALPDAWLADVPVAAGDMLEETGVDMDRRGFGGLVAGAVAAITLPEVAMPARVTASHIRYLRTCADNLWKRDQAVGGAALLRQALRQWQRARRMLDESSYSEAAGSQLLGVAGDLAVCAGWLAFDAANVPLARRMYSEALLLAGGAGVPGLTAQVLAQSSMLSTYVARSGGANGLAREGLRLADQAASAAQQEHMPRLHALIQLRRANAASLLGDEPVFRSAISRARQELDRGISTDDPAWIQFVDEFEISGQEAMGHMNLGAPATSAVLHQESLDRPDLPARNRTCAQAQLSAALVASGDVAAAVSEASAVLPVLADGVTSMRALNELRPVRVAAERINSEEFCTRFDAVEQTLTA